MGVLTAIITSLGGIMGLAKNFFELRSTIKELFKKDIQLNKAFSDLSKRDEKVLTDLYRAIETGRELSNRLYKKLAIKYGITIILFIIIFIGVIFFLQSILLFTPLIILAGFITGYLFITTIFPVPFKFNLKILNEKVREIANHKSYFGEVYKVRRLLGLINWVTPSENKYLQHYLDLCSLRDTLEIYWIDRKLEEAMTYINETVIFKTAIEDTLIDIFEDAVKMKKDVLINRAEISDKIKGAGLERYLLMLSDSFFQRDFFDTYQREGRAGLYKILKQYLP